MVHRLYTTEWIRNFFVGLAVFMLILSQIPAEAAGTPSKARESWEITGEGDFVVWDWSGILEELITEIYAQDNSEILEQFTFVRIDGSLIYYDALYEILEDPTDPLYPDFAAVPLVMSEYMDKSHFLSADDLGITADDMSQMFPISLELVKDGNGDIRGFCPWVYIGAFQVRKDLAEEYLGTTDPVELHDRYFSNPKGMLAAARRVYLQSNGMVSLVTGYDDLCAGRMYIGKDFSWYNSNGLLADDVSIARVMRLMTAIDSYSFGYNIWDFGWMDAMEGDGVNTQAAIAYTGATWMTALIMPEIWNDNTIIVEGYNDSVRGGTAWVVPEGCYDTELAADIIRTLVCDTDAMMEVSQILDEFVNNIEVIEQVIASGNDEKEVFSSYLPITENSRGLTMTEYDDEIYGYFEEYMYFYYKQGGDSMGVARDFLNAVVELHPELRTQ